MLRGEDINMLPKPIRVLFRPLPFKRAMLTSVLVIILVKLARWLFTGSWV